MEWLAHLAFTCQADLEVLYMQQLRSCFQLETPAGANTDQAWLSEGTPC